MVSFDGPEFLSHEVNTIPDKISELIKFQMNGLASHLEALSFLEHKVVELISYFKVDSKFRLTFLFTSKIKTIKRDKTTKSYKSTKNPLIDSFSRPKFYSPISHILKTKSRSQRVIKRCRLCTIRIYNTSMISLRFKDLIKGEKQRVGGRVASGVIQMANFIYKSKFTENMNEFYEGEVPQQKSVPEVLKRLFPDMEYEDYLLNLKSEAFLLTKIRVCNVCAVRFIGIVGDEENRKVKNTIKRPTRGQVRSLDRRVRLEPEKGKRDILGKTLPSLGINRSTGISYRKVTERGDGGIKIRGRGDAKNNIGQQGKRYKSVPKKRVHYGEEEGEGYLKLGVKIRHSRTPTQKRPKRRDRGIKTPNRLKKERNYSTSKKYGTSKDLQSDYYLINSSEKKSQTLKDYSLSLGKSEPLLIDMGVILDQTSASKSNKSISNQDQDSPNSKIVKPKNSGVQRRRFALKTIPDFSRKQMTYHLSKSFYKVKVKKEIENSGDEEISLIGKVIPYSKYRTNTPNIQMMGRQLKQVMSDLGNKEKSEISQSIHKLVLESEKEFLEKSSHRLKSNQLSQAVSSDYKPRRSQSNDNIGRQDRSREVMEVRDRNRDASAGAGHSRGHQESDIVVSSSNSRSRRKSRRRVIEGEESIGNRVPNNVKILKPLFFKKIKKSKRKKSSSQSNNSDRDKNDGDGNNNNLGEIPKIESIISIKDEEILEEISKNKKSDP